MSMFTLIGEVAIRGGQAVVSGLRKIDSAAQNTAQKLEQLGQRAQEVGGNIAEGVSAPLGVVGIAASKMAADVQSGTAKVQASLGVTRGRAEELGKVAHAVWRNAWGESLAEANDGVIKVTQNMGKMSPKTLQDVTESAFMLRDVFQADIQESTRAAGVMMKNFGISGKQAMDLITFGFQNGGDYAGDLLDTLTEYSPQFQAMGFSADQMMGILIQGAQAGAFNLDKVGDAIKEMNIRMKDGSDTTAEAFKALGLNAKQMEADFAAGGERAQQAFVATMAALSGVTDEAKRNQLGVALMGTQYEDLEKTVVASMSKGAQAHIDFKGAADQAKNAVDTDPYVRLQAVLREMADALVPLGNALLDLAERYGPPLAEMVGKIGAAFGKLPAPVQGVIVGIGAFAAALGPALMIFGSMVNGVTGLIGAFNMLKGGATGTGNLLKTVFNGMKTAVTAAFNGIRTGVQFLMNGLRMIGPVVLRVANILRGGFVGAIRAVIMVMNLLRIAFLTNPFGLIITAVVVAVALIIMHWDKVKSFLITAWNYIKSVAVSVWNGLVSFFKTVFNLYVTIIKTQINIIKTVITTVWNAIKSVTTSVWNGIKSFFSSVWNGIKSVAKAALTFYINYVKTVWNGIKSVTTSVWNGIKSFISSAWSAIKSAVSSAMNGIRSTMTSIWNSIKSAVSSAWNTIKSLVKNGITSAWNTIKGYASRFLSAGKGLLDALAKGIKQGLSAAVSAVKNGMAKIRSFLPFSPAKEGPLSDLDKSGESFFPTFASKMSADPMVKNITRAMLLARRRLQQQMPSFNVGGMAPMIGPSGAVISGNTFHIREEADIERVARRLFQLQRERQRGPGGRNR